MNFRAGAFEVLVTRPGPVVERIRFLGEDSSFGCWKGINACSRGEQMQRGFVILWQKLLVRRWSGSLGPRLIRSPLRPISCLSIRLYSKSWKDCIVGCHGL
jgi:hypothetical protein